MASAPLPHASLTAADDGVVLFFLPHELMLDPLDIMALAPPPILAYPAAADDDGVGSDHLPPPPPRHPFPLLPHQMFHTAIDDYNADMQDFMPPPEIDYADMQDLMPPPEIDDGLPEEVIAGFLKTTACGKAAAAADGGDPELCAVCLDDLHQEDRAVGVLGCRHGFHGDCIGKWLRKKNTCPLCRAIALETL